MSAEPQVYLVTFQFTPPTSLLWSPNFTSSQGATPSSDGCPSSFTGQDPQFLLALRQPFSLDKQSSHSISVLCSEANLPRTPKDIALLF